MTITAAQALGFAVALGVGLLVGVERERRKGVGPDRAVAGVRTFTIAALLGAACATVDGDWLVAAATLGVALLTAAAYRRARAGDPGLTTEIALILMPPLGALAMRAPALAAGLGVAVAILLAARDVMHGFVRGALSEREIADGLALGAAALIVLPLMPDAGIGPWAAFNPRVVWTIVVLVMAVGAVGHVALRALGPRTGLPLAGLVSGFVSSTATIGAMGVRAAREPAIARPAIAAAVLSTVATVAQLALVLTALDRATLRTLAPSLVGAGLAALAYGAVFTLRALAAPAGGDTATGRAFEPRAAVALALVVAAVLFGAAALNDLYGARGALVAAAIAGLVDAHAAAASVATLAADGKLPADAAALAILAGFTANTAAKLVVAFAAGGARFAGAIAPGLALVAAAAWAGFFLAPRLAPWL